MKTEEQTSLIERAKRHLDTGLEWVCVVLFAALVITVTWQVFTRQVLSQPSPWSGELAKYIFIWLGLLGSALVFGERGHLAVDFVLRKMNGVLQYIVALFVQVCVIVFSIVVLIQGGLAVTILAWDQNLSALPFNVGWLYSVLPATGVLVVLYSLYNLIAIATKKEPPVETEERDVV